MGRHRFGEGEYRYFNTPYPEPIERLKQALYPRLLPIARDWWTKLGRPAPWPDTLDEWLDMCHEAGQTKSSAILLRYREKDWNALHRDLYGELVFPLQVVINLNEPDVDHTGGEFLLLEQRPRAQSRGTATLLPHGHGYLFTTRDRPVSRPADGPPRRCGTAFQRSVPASGTHLHSSSMTPHDDHDGQDRAHGAERAHRRGARARRQCEGPSSSSRSSRPADDRSRPNIDREGSARLPMIRRPR